ncbi:hypothetical protein V9K67_18175 [Paraflavisolibacter sp. H34]|uniref:hypothetical protein n=1 Tax=Huijunlia imazamoxiresistens TaxID=3127457 RepID=UPI003019E58B
MNKVYFTYNDKTVSGDIKISLDKEPRFAWCYLGDPELVGELEQSCIFFVCDKGTFKTPHYYSPRFRPLIGTIENAIRDYLSGCA